MARQRISLPLYAWLLGISMVTLILLIWAAMVAF